MSFQKLGHLLKVRGLIGEHRVPVWEIALGLVLYQLGLSFRKTAKVLGLLGKGVSHVAVWYWNRKVGKEGIKLHRGLLPPVIVVDETWVGPGSLNSEGGLPGEWPREVITEGGSWYKVAFSFWWVEGKITWRIVRGGKRSVIEGFFGEFLKRWIKGLGRYFPTRGLDSLRRWLWSFAWLHNLIMDGCF